MTSDDYDFIYPVFAGMANMVFATSERYQTETYLRKWELTFSVTNGTVKLGNSIVRGWSTNVPLVLYGIRLGN
jgi:hypothetical protein